MKTATYPIPHDDVGGTLFLFGRPSSSRIMLFCAGFPDDHSSFISLAERFADDKNCFVGVTCLPGYDKIASNDGYSFTDWAFCMQEAAKALRSKSTTTTTTAKFTGVFHDWGCVAGGMFAAHAIKNGPTNLIPDEIILMDVGMPPHPKADVNNKLQVHGSTVTAVYTFAVTFAYQIFLAQCFLLQYYVSPFLAGVYFQVGRPILSWLKLFPLTDVDMPYMRKRVETIGLGRITYMAYPYYNIWKAIFTGQVLKELPGFCLPLNMETTPVLYLYGADKAIHFHDAQTEAMFHHEEEQGRRSKIVKVDKAGHWLYVQQEDVCFQEMTKFLEMK